MQPGKWQDEHRPLVDERGNVIGIVSAKLDAGAALAASGALPENVNYAVKSREGRHVAVPNFRDARRPSIPGICADGFGQAQSAQYG